MGLIRSFFAGRQQSPSHVNTQSNASGHIEAASELPIEPKRPAARSISYDPTLVSSLLNDHRSMVAAFQQIGAAASRRDAQSTRKALRQFKSLLTDHLIVENTRFYLYVKATMEAADPESAQLAKEFQLEMNQIARGVSVFVEKYSGDDNAVSDPAFLTELDAVGQALARRISREESTLYPLYAPD